MKSVVLIGGGHGLSNLVKGFKCENLDLNIIVASTDDGGHTGMLREEFDCVAVGDLRMVLNELLSDKSVLKDMFDYRFNKLHGVENISLGNLLIVSLIEKYKDINGVIKYFKDKENISANVYLSSSNPVVLCAEDECGNIVKFERIIGESNCKIKQLFVDGTPIVNEEMIEKIKNADIIALSPGSLYTSVAAVLCIDKINEAIRKSKASIVYSCNIMTQDGETKDFSVKDHVDVLENVLGKRIDRIIVNDGDIPLDVLEKYKKENSKVVVCQKKEKNYEFYDVVEIKEGKIRHNSELVKKIILSQG